MLYKEYTLKNDKNLIVRDATFNDAIEFADLTNKTHDETEFLTFSSKEMFSTEETAKEYISKFVNNDKSCLLVAVCEGRLVGRALIVPKSKHLRMQHRCELGIGVLKAYWGQGIAGKLMIECIEFAKHAGYEQIELIVVAPNERAHELYKSFGFVDEGEIKNSFKYEDGRYADAFMMVKFLK